MAIGGGYELLVLPALVVGVSLRPALVSTGRCDHVGLAQRGGIPAAECGDDGICGLWRPLGGGPALGCYFFEGL